MVNGTLVKDKVYILVDDLRVCNPITSKMLDAGSSVIYLGSFSGFSMICEEHNGNKTNFMCPITDSQITILDDKTLELTAEILSVYTRRNVSIEEASQKGSYNFTLIAKHILDNYKRLMPI